MHRLSVNSNCKEMMRGMRHFPGHPSPCLPRLRRGFLCGKGWPISRVSLHRFHTEREFPYVDSIQKSLARSRARARALSLSLSRLLSLSRQRALPSPPSPPHCLRERERARRFVRTSARDQSSKGRRSAHGEYGRLYKEAEWHDSRDTHGHSLH